jgi:hypothetical protein
MFLFCRWTNLKQSYIYLEIYICALLFLVYVLFERENLQNFRDVRGFIIRFFVFLAKLRTLWLKRSLLFYYFNWAYVFYLTKFYSFFDFQIKRFWKKFVCFYFLCFVLCLCQELLSVCFSYFISKTCWTFEHNKVFYLTF